MSALDKQEGGDHYKKLKIQPVEYIVANEIPFREASVIKYVTRWKDKGGFADIRKAIHFLEMILDEEPKSEDIKIGEAVIIPEGYRILNKRHELLGPGVKIWGGEDRWNNVNPEMYGFSPASSCTYICPGGV